MIRSRELNMSKKQAAWHCSQVFLVGLVLITLSIGLGRFLIGCEFEPSLLPTDCACTQGVNFRFPEGSAPPPEPDGIGAIQVLALRVFDPNEPPAFIPVNTVRPNEHIQVRWFSRVWQKTVSGAGCPALSELASTTFSDHLSIKNLASQHVIIQQEPLVDVATLPQQDPAYTQTVDLPEGIVARGQYDVSIKLNADGGLEKEPAGSCHALSLADPTRSIMLMVE